ncbi:unnamed protein product [Cyclocybe aegerita]|uniref:Uncharacterized protein n=1 Tax=Cyclocybe aegerita TaxID=1973307 RepID=A0A8S0WR57_CYCAE|nr:unnamed protein product [Cyclocybe aegerita]
MNQAVDTSGTFTWNSKSNKSSQRNKSWIDREKRKFLRWLYPELDSYKLVQEAEIQTIEGKQRRITELLAQRNGPGAQWDQAARDEFEQLEAGRDTDQNVLAGLYGRLREEESLRHRLNRDTSKHGQGLDSACRWWAQETEKWCEGHWFGRILEFLDEVSESGEPLTISIRHNYDEALHDVDNPEGEGESREGEMEGHDSEIVPPYPATSEEERDEQAESRSEVGGAGEDQLLPSDPTTSDQHNVNFWSRSLENTAFRTPIQIALITLVYYSTACLFEVPRFPTELKLLLVVSTLYGLVRVLSMEKRT